MKTILCKNRYRDSSANLIECGRFLACLSDYQVEALKQGGKSIFRCPKCRPEDRWVKVEGRNGVLVFAVCSTDERPDFSQEPEYGEIEAVEQAV